MSGKIDRKAAMRESLAEEGDHAESRLTVVDKRFAAAAAVDRASDHVPPTFSAESGTGNRIRVKIDLVDDNPYNPRQIYLPEKIKERAASIAAHGQQEAAKAAAHPEKPGRYALIDGGYRKRALLLLGKDEIDLELREIKSPLEFYTLGRLFNKERDDQTALDDALAWQLMVKTGLVASEEALVDVVGYSWPQINKCLALTKLPAPAIEKLREHPEKFGVAIGYELYQFSTFSAEDALMSLIARILAEDLSSREVEQIRKAAQNPTRRAPKQTSRQYKFFRDESHVGYVKDWDNGRVTFEIRGLDEKARQDLVDDLRKRFGGDDQPQKGGSE